MFVETLYAAGKGAANPGAAIAQMVPLILIFVVFYFLLIRPQQKRAKEHKKLLSELKKGDEVITSGGIYGKIVGITDEVLTLEIADNVKIKIARTFVSAKSNK